MSEYDRVAEMAAALYERGVRPTRLALVLGSGLGSFGEALQEQRSWAYGELPGFVLPTVSGHAGRLLQGKVGGVEVTVLQGRVHGYEGHSPAEVVRAQRALVHLGVRGLLLTNAAGGLEPGYAPGDLMLITDHLNLTGTNPLIGELDERWPSRFADMTGGYSPRLGRVLLDVAREQDLPLHQGVYAGVPGGAYETPAEIRMLGILGAQAVGMSTVHEALAARHLGAEVVGISCITNLAAGLSPDPLTHDEVKVTAKRIEAGFSKLLWDAVPRIHALLPEPQPLAA